MSCKPEETGQAAIRVKVDPAIKDLVPRFLKNMRTKAEKLLEALQQKDWETVRLMGHQLKGIGGVYGFGPITEIGGDLEIAVRQADLERMRRGIDRLVNYLDRVEVVFE